MVWGGLRWFGVVCGISTVRASTVPRAVLGHGRHQVYISIFARLNWCPPGLPGLILMLTVMSRCGSQPSLIRACRPLTTFGYITISATTARQLCSWRPWIAASCCLTGRKGSVSRPSLKARRGISIIGATGSAL